MARTIIFKVFGSDGAGKLLRLDRDSSVDSGRRVQWESANGCDLTSKPSSGVCFAFQVASVATGNGGPVRILWMDTRHV